MRPLSLLVPALILFVSPIASAAEQLEIPSKLYARIGGFGGPNFSVELKNGVVTYTVLSAKPKGVVIKPTAQQWKEFRGELDSINVWQWKDSYPNREVSDGTQWAAEIAYRDHSLKTKGSNNYPDAAGKPNGKPEPTEEFSRYLGAVKKLIGGRDFH